MTTPDASRDERGETSAGSLDMDHRQWRDHEDRIQRLEERMTDWFWEGNTPHMTSNTTTPDPTPALGRLMDAIANAIAENHGYDYDVEDASQVILHNDLDTIRRAIAATPGVLVVGTDEAREIIADYMDGPDEVAFRSADLAISALTAAGFAIVPTAAADTVTISRKELDEAVHWFLPSASQANAIIADIITRATRGGTQ